MSIDRSPRRAAVALVLSTLFLGLSRPATADTGIVIATPRSAFAGLTRVDPFSLTMTAIGGSLPYAWSVEPGSALPQGLSLSSGGLITGAPQAGGTFSFTIRVTAANSTATRAYTVDIYRAPKPKPIDIPYSITSIYMPKPSWPSHQWGDIRMLNEQNYIKNARAQRYPLLGYYRGDDPEVLDWQIKMAVDRGITGFAFHDYWISGFPKPVYATSIDAFRAARYRRSMSYSVIFNFCQTSIGDGAARRACFLQEALPYYVSHYFPDANYQRIDGKPVIQILHIASSLGTLDPEVIQDFMEEADQYIADHTGYDGAYWIATELGAAHSTDPISFAFVDSVGFDAVSPGYVFEHMWPATPGVGEHWPLPAGHPGIPYSELYTSAIDFHIQNFQQSLATGVKYITAVAPDFDWRAKFWDTEWSIYYTGQNHFDYWQIVSNVRALAIGYPSALPISTNTGKPLIGIGPWNEQIESSTVEPGYSVFQWPGGGNEDPYFISTTIAKLFGGPATYDEYPPDHEYGRGFPVKDEWTFSTATGAGLDEWNSETTAGLQIGPGNVLQTFGYGPHTHLLTQTNLPLASVTHVTVRFRIDEGADSFLGLGLDARSSTYSDTAHEFGAPLEPGGAFNPPEVQSTPCGAPAADGFRTCTLPLQAKGAGDTLRYMGIRFFAQPLTSGAQAPVRYSVQRVAIE